MKFTHKLTAVATFILFIAVGTVMSAESIRVTSDIDSESAVFDVKQSGVSGTEVKLDIPAIEIAPTSLNSTTYQKVQLPGAEHLFQAEIAEDGMPDLPAITTNIAVPDMAGIDFTVDYESYEIINDVDIAPTQPPTLESGQNIPPFTIDSDFYSRDEFYPEEIAEVHDPVIMRDIRMVQVVMYPVQYNPVRRQLKVYRNISVNLSYDGNNVVNPKTHRSQYISEAFLPIYQSIIPNFDDIYSTLDIQRGGILIIAKDIFVDTLRAFANWKHRKGYTVHLAGTTEINENGNPTQIQVYNYIKNAYDNWQIPPEYVMIVGDQDNTSSTGIPDYPYNGYNSDQNYSQVDGTDYLPDVFVARFSIDNMSQLRIALAKALDYENNPYMDDPVYWHRGLSVAGNVYATTPRITVLWVRSLLLEYGFTDVDTSFRWASSQSDPYLLGYFNEGPCLISYRGWAGSSGWYSPTFNTSNLDQIQNHNKLGIMASIVCGTCDFGTNECFGEKWIRMGSSTTSYKGGPAAWGSTDHSTHTRWNNPIMTGYYWSIFKENNPHFAAAAVRGKIQQYNTFPRYNASGGTIEQYFHTYNMLGDPEISIRTKTPIMLTVDSPTQIDVGLNHITVNVLDNTESPVEGAYVTLYKEVSGEEELWVAEKTDAYGNVTLTFDPPSTGQMMLTVSGRDLYPVQRPIDVVSGNTIVGFDSYDIDDDNSGYSSGNGDGVANPGETIELSVDLMNFGSGSTANNVSAVLESIDDGHSIVHVSESEFGNIAPGVTGTSQSPYVIKIKPKTQNNDTAHLKITATDSGNDVWESSIEIPVVAPKLHVSAVTFPGGNGHLDPGETIEMVLTVENLGTLAAANVTGEVVTFDDYTFLPSASCTFGNIPAGGSANNSTNPLMITSDSETFDGHTVNLVLHTVTAAGYTSEIPFTVSVGQVATSDPTGPDAYGYHMFDNTDTGYGPTPTYEWVEIVPSLGGQGTRMSFVGGTDDGSNVIILPFDFIYYGESFGAMIVCTNGFAALDTFTYDMGGNYWFNFFNWPIPDPGNARGQISPFWDDLSYSGSANGVYTWYDSENHRFIIEWYQMTHRNTGASETFEMIITDPQYHPTLTGDSEILYQYKTIVNNDTGENYASVGYESWDELMGLEYTYDNYYGSGAATLANNRAIKITTNTGRGGVSGMVDLNNSGLNGDVRVETEFGRIRFTSEDGSYWLRNVPPGTVDITASIRGWFPVTMSDVNVTADVTTQNVDFNMTKCDVPDNLDASEGLGDRIELTWGAISHSDLDGYNIYRSNWENGDYVKLNTDPVTNNAYTDNTIPDNGIYWYIVTAVYSGSYGNAESIDSDKAYGSTDIVTGIGDEIQNVPREFFISQNYPNPFNPQTTISYGLPNDSDVRIDIFNVLGQRVVTLVDERQSAGFKSVIWNGDDAAGSKVSSGVYFYTIEAGDHHASKKMLLIK